MSMTEKAAYLKGLADGMDLADGKNEKLLKAIIDTIGDICADLDDLDEDLDVFCEQLDAVDEDLNDLEDYVYDDEDDFDCGCGCCDDEEGLYDVECPACGEVFSVDDEMLEDGGCECPNCGENLDFDFDCDCDCCDCDDCDE